MLELLDYRTNKNRLREPGHNVDLSEIQTFSFQENLKQMEEILQLDGVGLAATQVGWSKKLFMLCIDEFDNKIDPVVFINPVIDSFSKKEEKMEEGCLSFKGLYLVIKRPVSIAWHYTTLAGETVTKESSGFYARAVQHEVDHCFGRVFLDRTSAIQKLKVNKWLKM